MTKSTLSKILIFVTGAAIGSFVSWKLSKDHYNKIADDEIAEVKAHFLEMTAMKRAVEKFQEGIEDGIKDGIKETPTVVTGHIPDKDISILNKYASKYRKPDNWIKPYVITPDEFGDRVDEGYETETLTYYADGVLTDDGDIEIDDVEGMVGLDAFDHFGEYEKDAVFVRNENHRTDYEILRDLRTFEEVVGTLNPQEGD